MAQIESDLPDLVARLRRVGAEPSDVEVKSAAGGLPKSVAETLSAFANGSGGTLLLGLSERDRFTPASGFEAAAIRDAVVAACVDQLTPPLRVPVEIEAFEGAHVVRVDVYELDPVDQPAFVTARGAHNGSFIRGGDGDRRLSHYEVTQLLSNRAQPIYDREPILAASISDLDETGIADFLESVRTRSPRQTDLSDTELLVQRGVLVPVGEGDVRPSLAGLLCFGRYPQTLFPQLFVSFVALPGLTMGETGPDGGRFLDNQSLTGPIPQIVQDATRAAIRNMNRAAIIEGLGREDRYDYPLDVVRELVVNALMHRDYSGEARGAQIQIEIYPDRLEVRSPGGLHGPATPAVLGTREQRSTSRNALLASLLSDIPIRRGRDEMLCENRGSGLQAVMKSLQRVGLSPPQFRASPAGLDVVVPRHALLDDDVIAWIASLGQSGLSEQQYLALAMMRSTGMTTNATLRAWGIEMHAASQALRDLVLRDLAVKSGGRRYATYRLNPELPSSGAVRPLQLELPLANDTTDPDGILSALQGASLTAREIAAATDLDRRTVLRRLRVLMDDRRVTRTGAQNSPTQTYRLTPPEEQP